MLWNMSNGNASEVEHALVFESDGVICWGEEPYSWGVKDRTASEVIEAYVREVRDELEPAKDEIERSPGA